MTASSSAAQDEFDQFIARNTAAASSRHPEDRGRGSDDENDDDAAPARSDDDDEHARGQKSRGTAWRGARAKEASTPDSEDDDDDDDDDTSSRPAAGNMKAARYFLPSRQHDANTGPKGVIADAYAFENAKKSRTSFFSSSSSSKKAAAAAAAAAASAQRQRPFSVAEKRAAGINSDDGEDGEGDDDDFMMQWRQSRLQELRNQEGKRRVSPPGGGKRWGTLQTVDGEGYLDAVERSGRGTVVLVFIYDDASDVSNTLEQFVRQLAHAHATTRFVRLHYEEAEMEGAGVPALLAYRDGDKFAGLVPLVDELPDDADLSAETLQAVMQRHQML